MPFSVPKVLVKSRSPRDGISDFGESMAVQADKERTDIRNIVRRAMRGASVTVNVRQPRYADIYDAPSYMEALNVVAYANDLFASLPSKVRDRFSNNPVKMLEFLDDDSNKEEAIKLGLRKKEADPPPPPEPLAVRIVDPPKS